jgi:hypothetical protein
LQASNKKHGHHVDIANVNASGSGTSDRVGFVVVLWQATILAVANQHARGAIRDEASKPKLVFLRHYHSIFFSINLVNVMILCFVV